MKFIYLEPTITDFFELAKAFAPEMAKSFMLLPNHVDPIKGVGQDFHVDHSADFYWDDLEEQRLFLSVTSLLESSFALKIS